MYLSTNISCQINIRKTHNKNYNASILKNSIYWCQAAAFFIYHKVSNIFCMFSTTFFPQDPEVACTKISKLQFDCTIYSITFDKTLCYVEILKKGK